MSLSPYEANILDFVNLVDEQPDLLSDKDYNNLVELLKTLPDDVEEISDALALWYDDRPKMLNAILEMTPSNDGVRGPGGRDTRLTAAEVKELLKNVVRQSSLPTSLPLAPPSNP